MSTLLSFDQASRTTGYSYFKDGKLIEINHFTCSGNDLGDRLEQFRNKVNQLLDEYSPDEVVFEDIQLQDTVDGKKVDKSIGIKTFKILAEVFGVLYELLTERKIPCQAVVPNSWKSTFGIAKKGRSAEKKAAQKYISTTYGINCTEDEADSACIGLHLLKKRDEEFDWS